MVDPPVAATTRAALMKASHGVGGELAATGPVAGTGDLFQFDQLLERAIAGAMLSDRFEHVDHGHVMAVEPSGKDRAAIDEDRRHVESQHRHHHAGQALVAAGIANHRVIAVATDTQLDAVGDHLAGHQRGLHPLMAHGNAVGDGDRVEPAGRAARRDHAFARDIRLAIKQGVAGGAVIARRGDADERLANIFLGHPHRIIIAALRGALGSDADVAAGQTGFIESVGHSGFQYGFFPIVLPKLRRLSKSRSYFIASTQ